MIYEQTALITYIGHMLYPSTEANELIVFFFMKHKAYIILYKLLLQLLSQGILLETIIYYKQKQTKLQRQRCVTAFIRQF